MIWKQICYRKGGPLCNTRCCCLPLACVARISCLWWNLFGAVPLLLSLLTVFECSRAIHSPIVHDLSAPAVLDMRSNQKATWGSSSESVVSHKWRLMAWTMMGMCKAEASVIKENYRKVSNWAKVSLRERRAHVWEREGFPSEEEALSRFEWEVSEIKQRLWWLLWRAISELLWANGGHTSSVHATRPDHGGDRERSYPVHPHRIGLSSPLPIYACALLGPDPACHDDYTRLSSFSRWPWGTCICS